MNVNYILARLRMMFSLHKYTATKCGHRTKRVAYIIAFGRTIITTMRKNKFGSVDYCHDCLSLMAIRCAWCERVIFVGDPITLYTPVKDFRIPEHAAVIHDTDPTQLVGCFSIDCANTGEDCAGFWAPGENSRGRVHRIPTGIEEILGL